MVGANVVLTDKQTSEQLWCTYGSLPVGAPEAGIGGRASRGHFQNEDALDTDLAHGLRGRYGDA